MNRLLILLLITYCFILSACTTAGYTMLSDQHQPRASGCSMDAYLNIMQVESSFSTICTVTSRVANTPLKSGVPSDALENALPLLCECGADAFVISDWDPSPVQSKILIQGIVYNRMPASQFLQVDGEARRSALEMIAAMRCVESGGRWNMNRCRF